MKFILLLKVLILCSAISQAFGRTPEWRFVHVAALMNEASVEQGTANVEFKANHFTARIKVGGQEWATISGTIHNGRVTAKYSVIGSDYTINSPFTGSVTRKTWSGMKDSAGRECIQPTDGFNFITLFHELAA